MGPNTRSSQQGCCFMIGHICRPIQGPYSSNILIFIPIILFSYFLFIYLFIYLLLSSLLMSCISCLSKPLLFALSLKLKYKKAEGRTKLGFEIHFIPNHTIQ